MTKCLSDNTLSVISAAVFLFVLAKTGLRSEFYYLDAMSLRLVRLVIAAAPCLPGDLAFRAELLDAVADLILIFILSNVYVKDKF